MTETPNYDAVQARQDVEEFDEADITRFEEDDDPESLAGEVVDD